MIYADSVVPEKDRRKDYAKQRVLFSFSILLIFHCTILWLSLNSSSSQVTFAIADSSGVCVILSLCITDRETDKMVQGSVPFPSVLSYHDIKLTESQEMVLGLQKQKYISCINSSK